MRSVDINFALSVILHTLVPPVKQQVTPSGGGSTKRHLSVSDSSGVGRTTSVLSQHGRKFTAPGDLLQTVAFLGNYDRLVLSQHEALLSQRGRATLRVCQ